MSYICKNCYNNNHGWCNIRQENGLKKLNIQRCKDFSDVNDVVDLREESENNKTLDMYTDTELLLELLRRKQR